ncbi:anthranilate phosphoribosyltransferase [candidate division KSB1 bacterium]
MIKECIKKVVEKENLTETEASEVMDEIMSGNTTPAQIGSFLTALRMKGETVDELVGFVHIMRQNATAIKSVHNTIIDTCGTGGDLRDTFNVSTISAFVAAGAGAVVAKHGNKAVSSNCGSADLLSALGLNIEVEPGTITKSLDEIGIGFLFAPLLHKAMKHAIGPRREIGIRSVFNLLGPLTNPAGATCQLMGVFNPEWTEKVAYVMKSLGTRNAYVVHGLDGLDEISTIGETQISELKNGEVKTYLVKPEDFNIQICSVDDIYGGSVEENVKTAMDILSGKSGAKRDMVLINSAAAIVASGLAETIEEGITLAAHSIDSGSALEKLEQLKKLYNN